MSNQRIHSPSAKTFDLAATILKEGDIISFPTETVYGLGADATNSSAIAKIYSAKERPSFNPLIVHILSAEKASQYVIMNELTKKLADAFWPGPFTMVLPLKEGSGISDLITAGLDTVAIRVPKNEIAHQLLELFSGAVAAPSANKSGQISPTTAAHVDGEFGDELSFIIDGGACEKGIESTIVQVTNKDVILLRPGNITISDIEKVIGCSVLINNADGTKPTSPGQLTSHYAPNSKMRLNATKVYEDECYLTFGNIEGDLNLSPAGNLNEAAANLFSMMRALDQMNKTTIAVAPIPFTGLGLAINDRLQRAAAPKDSS
ncbi:MAG: threonylcarbamoyl-AMP synthase [Kordiimonadaceae bacterium]|nr:threonylcarbamoyl-AMP synthase [Kordiimonadaceae bacterium]MBT6031020.1 threonylcarbamoyl-AMP synthase [Kordiimonadaceae bacterium]